MVMETSRFIFFFLLQNLPFLLGAYLFLLVLWNDVIIGQLLPSNEYCQFTIPLVCLTDYCSFCTFQVLLSHIKYLFTDLLQNSCCLNLLTCWWILDVCSYETKDVCVIKGCFFLAYWCTNSYRKEMHPWMPQLTASSTLGRLVIFGYVRGLMIEEKVIRIIEVVRLFFFVRVILILR